MEGRSPEGWRTQPARHPPDPGLGPGAQHGLQAAPWPPPHSRIPELSTGTPASVHTLHCGKASPRGHATTPTTAYPWALTSPGIGENARPNDCATVNHFIPDTHSQGNQYSLSGYSTVGGVLWSHMHAHLVPRQGAQARAQRVSPGRVAGREAQASDPLEKPQRQREVGVSSLAWGFLSDGGWEVWISPASLSTSPRSPFLGAWPLLSDGDRHHLQL